MYDYGAYIGILWCCNWHLQVVTLWLLQLKGSSFPNTYLDSIQMFTISDFTLGLVKV